MITASGAIGLRAESNNIFLDTADLTKPYNLANTVDTTRAFVVPRGSFIGTGSPDLRNSNIRLTLSSTQVVAERGSSGSQITVEFTVLRW